MPVNGAARRRAYSFLVLMGLVSLFADMTYEAARGVTGPYLALLGASATTVGVVAGLGELLGYGLRLASGLLSDRTRRYWTITIVGYAVNLLAVPAMALAGRWEVAAALMLLERLGKALRTPARDAMLSHAARAVGSGWGFALHEAMDQVGAMLGPIIVTAVLAIKGSYSWAFGVLAAPALLALAVLVAARRLHPQPRDLEVGAEIPDPGGFDRTFRLYLLAAGLVAAAFADFPLVAFHIKARGILADQWIPLLYAGAMGVDALAALAFGRWYDRKGLIALQAAVAASALFAPLAFSGSAPLVMAGMALWGVGMGAQESILRAVVGRMVPADRRATGYGVFNAGFGLAWFAGSSLMGLLYDVSLPALMAFSVAGQLLALPVLQRVKRRLAAR
jgi:MFS family permease